MLFKIEKNFPSPIAGVDEAGRGALVGPVVAAAVIIDKSNIINGIKDSKKLSKEKRNFLYQKIIKSYIYSIGVVHADEIDRTNILLATQMACNIAVNALPISPKTVLVDGNMKFSDFRFNSVINGDNLSFSIAAASIVAKVTRDSIILDYAQEYNKYFWHTNFGYGTKQHVEAIKRHGLSIYHRKTFRIK